MIWSDIGICQLDESLVDARGITIVKDGAPLTVRNAIIAALEKPEFQLSPNMVERAGSLAIALASEIHTITKHDIDDLNIIKICLLTHYCLSPVIAVRCINILNRFKSEN